MTVAATTLSHHPYRVMGLIGVGHGASHFFHLVVPSLFPLIKLDLGVSYAQLGLLTTLMFVVSGISQTVCGFLVDHLGARRILFTGLALLAGAIFLCGLAPGYPALLVLMAVAGLGNAVFHPADYAILGGSIARGRLGRAYGIHTLGGNLGWAAAPATMLFLAQFVGWRGALMIAGGIGFAILLLLVSQAAFLDDGRARRPKPADALGAAPQAGIASILFSLPVLLCFAYFVLLATGQIGMQNFLPSILGALNGTPLTTAGTALTAFLLGSTAGVAVGMMYADRTERHHLTVAGGLSIMAALVLIIAEVDLAATVLIATVAVAGAALGFTIPSRDLVVRQATPPGATGRVFGFVYSGLDVGSAVAPVTIGLMLDHNLPRLTLWLVAILIVAAIGIALLLQRVSDRRPPLS
ncbi:MAG: MFS transporter [Bauldia sp.]